MLQLLKLNANTDRYAVPIWILWKESIFSRIPCIQQNSGNSIRHNKHDNDNNRNDNNNNNPE